MKKSVPTGAISPNQYRYLYRRFVFLYLHSAQARKDFENLVDRQNELAVALGIDEPEVPEEVSETAAVEQESFSLLEALPAPKFKILLHLNQPLIRRRIAKFSALLLAVVALQFVYPHDRTMPFSRLQAYGFVGFQTKQEILSKYQDFDKRTLTVHTHNKNLTTSYSDLGVTLTPDDTVNDLTSYSTAQRLIPFSFLFVGNKTFTMSRHLDEPQLALFAKDIIPNTNEAPQSAVVKLEGTKLSVTPAKVGYEYQLSYLRSQVLKSDLTDKLQLVFKPTILDPSIPTDIVTYNAARAQDRINSPLTVQADDKTIRFESNTLASWLEISEKPDSHTIEFSFNRAKVADSLRSFPSQVDVPSSPFIITTLNGIQAGTGQGEPGRSLQFEDLVDKVVAATSPVTQTIEATVLPVAPQTVYERKYSKDNAGLQSLFGYWTSTHSGRYSIDFRTANDRIEANLNPYQTYPAVGIYRIYIAHNIYGRITAKSLSGSTPTMAGISVDTCLSKMLRESNEACTNALGDIVGWGASDDLLHAQGFDSTTLAQGAAITTANDTSDWMYKLLDGSIASRSGADTITSYMRGETNRSGIPAGSRGMAVSNKAGSYGRTKHDVGIVYHPRGTYVLSVLTDGASFADIAGLTAEINKVMDQ